MPPAIALRKIPEVADRASADWCRSRSRGVSCRLAAGGDDEVMGVLLSGIPGTGKSSFSRWLVEHHGFVHFDVDIGRLPSPTDLAHPRAVLHWRFPAGDRFPETVEILLGFDALGVARLWFDGDRAAALESYLGAGKPKGDWDIQLAGIEAHWIEIEALSLGAS
jgi:hypothetical protein